MMHHLPWQQIEARSVAHLQKLNKGMENKIIELQQKLTDQVGGVVGGVVYMYIGCTWGVVGVW